MKYRFEIVHSSKEMIRASEFIKKLDFGFDVVGIKDVITFNSKNDIEINKFKKDLSWAFEQCEGKLLHIEGGKVE